MKPRYFVIIPKTFTISACVLRNRIRQESHGTSAQQLQHPEVVRNLCRSQRTIPILEREDQVRSSFPRPNEQGNPNGAQRFHPVQSKRKISI